TVRVLQAQREELLEQLQAIDEAIAALRGALHGDVEPVKPLPAADTPAADAVPRKIKPKRVLSDEHKHALTTGRRKAREARDAAAGLAGGRRDESFVGALAPRPVNEPPRLVKRHPRRDAGE